MSQGILRKRGQKDCRNRGMEDTGEYGPLNQLDRAGHLLTHRDWRVKHRASRNCIRSSPYAMAVSISVSVCISDSFACSWRSFSWWVALSSLGVRAFALSCCILLCRVYFLSLGGRSFLKGDIGGSRGGGGTGWSGERGNWSELYCMREKNLLNLLSIKIFFKWGKTFDI